MFILIGIGAIVLFNITGAIEPMAENNPTAQSAENVLSDIEETTGSTAFNLMSILVIVVIAAIIIGVCLRSLGGAFAPPPGGG